MAQLMILIAPKSWDPNVPRHILEVMAETGGGSVIRSGESTDLIGPDRAWYISLSAHNASGYDAIEDYATNDDLPQEFRISVRSARLFLVNYNRIGPAREMLRRWATAALEAGMQAWLDTDYGWVARVDDVVREIQRDPAWDWRHPADDSVST